GACDALAGGRREALWRLGAAAPAYSAGDGGTQLSLGLELPAAPELPPLREWDAMIADYATTGLTIERHPLRLLRPGLSRRGVVSSAGLAGLPHDAHVHVAGLVVARQRPGTAKGVVFLLLEDETGTVNVIIPPKVYERDRLVVRTEPLVAIRGKLERFASAGGAINVLVHSIVPLDAPELLEGRPRHQVKDFSLLDARELARATAERSHSHQPASPAPRVAVAVAGAATASHVRPAADEAPEAGEQPGAAAEDFRAVAPPIMSFAQGRRR
ncbi:MAG TPA: OB-fold nucleic acid binding domain-containing protein, partial [Solirubrobacteraceae bacterium]|nr:OB-fold nucleic acid binding domain-containing protein [Solirubrobacteraceae bacterium]